VPVRAELIAYVEDQGSRQRQAARRSLASLKDRLRAAGAGLPRPANLVATQRQRLDMAASQLSGALRDSVGQRRLAFSHLAATLQPRLVRQRHAELGERLVNLQRHAASGLTKTVERARLRLDPPARQLPSAVATALERKQAALARVRPRLSDKPLRAELRHAESRLAPFGQRLGQAGRVLTTDRRQQLEQLGKLLETLSYRNVLARGYALVQDEAGEVVSSQAGARPGDALRLTFADGEVGVTVAGAPPVRRKPVRPGPDDGSQESLF
jgi:exodeoxyribonuclease VII large subunit